MAELGFAELLELLGHTSFTSICRKAPGGRFYSAVVASREAPTIVATECDAWFGVQPLTRIPNDGRGTAADVERLVTLYADLDVKAGGLVSFDDANDVIAVLSDMLGVRPSALVFTGHGCQPYWPVENGPNGPEARALLRRWGRLVAHVAQQHGGEVDMVYDLPRVLRIPGTTNYKYKSKPVPVIGVTDAGWPLTVAEIDEALTAYGAVEMPGDREDRGAVVSAPADWRFAPQTCHYSIAMMGAWATETPGGRHPWLLRQATRIACAHRYGCFDEAGYHGIVGVLVNRFRDLLSRGPNARAEAPGEIADALAWGRDLAASKSATELATELGSHSHERTEGLDPNLGDMPADGTIPSEGDLRRSWRPIDLSPVLAGDRKRPTPTVGARTDGIGMFYPGKCHTVSGESEGGKSWLALHACLTEMDRGNNALYIDFEDDEYSVTDRLLLMGAKPDLITTRFTYLAPQQAIGGDGTNREDLKTVLGDISPTVAILDGVTEALTMHGYDANKNNEVATFGRLLPTWIANRGPAVISLDHVVKNTEGRGRYAIGAVHKLNGLNGAAYTVVNRHQFGVGRKGVSYIRIQKDRPAQLRVHAVESGGEQGRDFWFADLVVDATGIAGIEANVEIYPPNPKDSQGSEHPEMMSAICSALAKHGPLSGRRIEAAVEGRAATIRLARDALILGGYISEKTPHVLIRQYFEGEE